MVQALPKNRVVAVVLCAFLSLLFIAAKTPTESKEESYKPLSEYEERDMEGWTVYVEKSLLEEHPELARETLRVAKDQLFNVTRVVPDPAVEKLRKVRIWIQYECEHPTCAAYHPSRKWLTQHGFNPEKEKSVNIGNARNFVNWTKGQWWMILHEMAHAYHDQVLGFDHPELKAGYERVKKAGLYDKVGHWSGRKKRHYALENHKEYFAEMTEAYFGVNDFYPFVRAELKECDPKTVTLIEKMWGAK